MDLDLQEPLRVTGVAEFLPSSPSKAWPPRQKALLPPRPYSFPRWRWRWTLGCDRGAVWPPCSCHRHSLWGLTGSRLP